MEEVNSKYASPPLSVGSLASSNTSLQRVTASSGSSGSGVISWPLLMLHIACSSYNVSVTIHSA